MLARRYREATVGLCLSLTNYSLIPQEMLACGLPCVDLAGASTEAELGRDGGIELAEPDPVAIADAIERLLDDRELWERRSRNGLAQVSEASWDDAARDVERGLREALRERERERRHRGLLMSAGAHGSAWPQHERAERAGTVAVAGHQVPARPYELDPMCARVQLERAQVQPVGGLRELVAGRAGMPAVDPHLHLAPERAAQPDLVAPRLAAPGASRAPRRTRPSERARDRPCGESSPMAAAAPRSATPGSPPRRRRLDQRPCRDRLPSLAGRDQTS